MKCYVCIMYEYPDVKTVAIPEAVTCVNGTAVCRTHVGAIANSDVMSVSYFEGRP